MSDEPKTPEAGARLAEAREQRILQTLLDIPNRTLFFRAGAFISADEWCYVGSDGKIHPVDGELQDGADQAVIEWMRREKARLAPEIAPLTEGQYRRVMPGIRGSHSPCEVKEAGRIIFEVTLHNCVEREVSPESFVGKQIWSAEGTEVIGLIVSAARRGNWIVGEVELKQGLCFADLMPRLPSLKHLSPLFEPAPIKVTIDGAPDEPRQETWRDKPSML